MNARSFKAKTAELQPPDDIGQTAEPDGQSPVGDAARTRTAGVEPDLRPVAPTGKAGVAAGPALLDRIARLERQNRWMKLGLSTLLIIVVGMLIVGNLSTDSIVKQTLMESKELKLVDKDGTARLFLRMYSRVPVLQILDQRGKPRMSLGLRFDDTPFLDLSDKSGRTRASLEMTAEDQPKLELFDANGDTTFKIK